MADAMLHSFASAEPSASDLDGSFSRERGQPHGRRGEPGRRQ